jgi:hypothetical protein
MKTQLVSICAAVLGGVLLGPSKEVEHNYVPKDGYIPNAKTAVRVATAVLEPIFGEDVVDRHIPFRAKLSNGNWTVEGVIGEYPHPNEKPKPGKHVASYGGRMLVVISKKTGAIVRVSADK